MTIAEQRRQVVASTLDRVRAIEAEQGVNRAALAAIRDEMIALAARKELFPVDEFPLEGDRGERFEVLSADNDGRFELYLEVANKSVETLPHDHTTWAVVVGIRGLELNKLYEGDGGPVGEAPLALREEVPVGPGTGVCMMPTDFHSIHMKEGVTNMHLHLYGLGFAHLKGRQMYEPASGTYMPYDPNRI